MGRSLVSVIVVSRDRPTELAMHLSCLRFQTVTQFETIVVSNQPLPAGPMPEPLRHISFDEANISQARNIGLAAATGDYIVFCDDDCLPEPAFVERLLAPFAAPSVGAAGGLTRGSNGVGLQWAAVGFDRNGIDHVLDLLPDAAYTLFAPEPQRFVKTIGTACAFRADALRAIGGFDPAYRYYFDETDVNLRLSEAGWSTAIVPAAQVHHAFAAGPHRTQRRIPRDMYEIGFSTARFCRLHSGEELKTALAQHRRNLRNRVFRHFEIGLIGRSHFRFLLDRLDAGIAAGQTDMRPSPDTSEPPIAAPAPPMPAASARDHFMIIGRKDTHGALAQALAARGNLVTLLDIRPSAYPLWARFDQAGYWHHQGGLFGQIERRGHVFQPRTHGQYIRTEIHRLAPFRRVNYLISSKKIAGPAAFLPELADMPDLRGLNVIYLGDA